MTLRGPQICFVFAILIANVCSFTATSYDKNHVVGCNVNTCCLQSKMNDNCEENESEDSSIPQLPAIGASSFETNGLPTIQEKDSQAAFVSPKFQLQYTCKVCDTRNCHLVSRIAYREGVVIAICKGCNAKHMIADNLGSGCMDGTSNIEEYFKTKGMEDIVNRVSSEVFELEKMLDFDGLLGEDGNPVLE